MAGCVSIIPGVTLLASLVAILIVIIVPTKLKNWVTVVAVLVNLLLTSFLSITALTGKTVELSIFSGSFAGYIPLKIDALSAWFMLIINFTCLTGIIYGIGYLKKIKSIPQQLSLHWSFFILFQLSMLWVCMLQHGLAFLVAWEIMSLSSTLLVIFDHNNPKVIRAGINYFVQMHLSVLFLSMAFIWVYFQTGSFNFEAIDQFFGTNVNTWLFLVFFIGFGLKAGFIPLHSWLPHAHPAAPSHVSGIMSGVIVKLGIYGILRMCTFLQTDFVHLGEIVLIISLLTGIYGILNAAIHRDFKRMLAYCTIENIGIIGIGIGIGLIGLGNGSNTMIFLGFGGALLHILNQSLFKSLLFFSAGSVYQQTHTRDMDKLGGLVKYMPTTAVLFLVGSIAICGLPPFNGFVSEFILYNGLIEGIKSSSISQSLLMVITLAGLSIIGGASVLAFTKTFGTIFLGNERAKLAHKPTEVSKLMLIPQFVIIGVMLSVAFAPGFYLSLISEILSVFKQYNVKGLNFEIPTSSIVNINMYFAIYALIIIVFWIIRKLFLRRLPISVNETWGCGYLAPTSRIQYTGKSFSKPLSKILHLLLIEKKQFKEIKNGEIFPKKRIYRSFYSDFFEHRFIDFIVQRLIYTANYFKFIQNGRTQSYVIYGFSFILMIFLFTFFYFLK